MLAARVNKFSAKLVSLQSAQSMSEYYLGPVLFEDDAVATILSENLVSPSGIISFRKPVQVMATVSRVEKCFRPKRD